MTGEVVEKIDTGGDDGLSTISLRLKRERGSDDHYVVLRFSGYGNTQYHTFEGDEFDRFSQAVDSIRNSLRQAQGVRT
jgi:hypothetical protein